MNRLAQALICLSDPVAKAAYDAELGLGGTPSPPAELPPSEGAPVTEVAFAPHANAPWPILTFTGKWDIESVEFQRTTIAPPAELDPAQHPFAVAVQWHPEAGEDLSLFRALAAAARSAEPVSA